MACKLENATGTQHVQDMASHTLHAFKDLNFVTHPLCVFCFGDEVKLKFKTCLKQSLQLIYILFTAIWRCG